MKKGKFKKGLAGLLALTVLFSSVFILAMKYDVFGAIKSPNKESNDFVDEFSGPQNSSVALKRTGSNLKNTQSSTFYGWDPNQVLNTTGLPVVPNQIGLKGSKENPFVLLEIVPDKSMMEMPYYAGNEESGMPFSEGKLSATFMNSLREGASGNYATIRFTDPRFEVGSKYFKKNEIETYIKNYFEGGDTKGLWGLFGYWSVGAKYDRFKIGDTIKQKENTKLYDCRDENLGTKKDGYAFNEIYNLDITDDIVLDTYPSSWDAPTSVANGEEYSYREMRAETVHQGKVGGRNIDGYSAHYKDFTEGVDDWKKNYHYAEYSKVYFTDDIISLAKRDSSNKSKTPTKTEVENFIKKYLINKNYDNSLVDEVKRYFPDYSKDFESITAEPTNSNGNVAKDNTSASSTKISKDIKKYNLQNYVMAQWAAVNAFKEQGYSEKEAKEQARRVAQDITKRDMIDSGFFDEYESSMGVMQRGGEGYTYNEDLDSSSFWKMEFRKYYYDRFNYLYAVFKDKQNTYESAISNYMNGQISALNNGLNPSTTNALNERNEALKNLMVEFEPLFTRQGVDVATFEDAYDWDVNEYNNVALNRSYVAGKQGGYILAVRPGKGELYLLNEKEIEDLMKGMTDKEIEKSGINKKSFIFTRNPDMLNGSNAEKANRKRWVYVSWKWGIEGDARSSTTNVYRAGILDDRRYTAGFASKSVIDGSHYWLAIYDRKNRKLHGSVFPGGRYSYDEISYKMYEKTNQVSDKNGYMRRSQDPSFTFNSREYTDSFDNNQYYQWSRDAAAPNRNFPVDDYHLNVMNEIKTQWGLNNNQLNKVKEQANLIRNGNREPGEVSYTEWDNVFGGKSPDFIHNMDTSERITGLCMNFNTDDVYDYSKAKGVSAERFYPANGRVNWPTGDYKYSNSDEVHTVSRNQLVAETGKRYHFTYYGFKANDILQTTLFNYQGYTDAKGDYHDPADEYKNFHFKVIVATPAELNQIYRGSVLDSSKLDLIERADMLYIHESKTKTYDEPKTNDIRRIYNFYNKMVNDEASVSYNNVVTFDDNDLDWELCQKIIQRSADKTYGANFPIMFNMGVGRAADEDEKTTGPNDKKKSTHMFIANRNPQNQTDDLRGKSMAGTELNIGKLYHILLQFDLRNTKGDEVLVDGDRVTIQRTFMDDIYPYLQSIKVSDQRRSNTRDANTAINTGYVPGYKVAEKNSNGKTVYTYRDRQLCTNNDCTQQFKEHSLYLWNRFTFYPWTLNDRFSNSKSNLVKYGYLESYYDNQNLFSDTEDLFYFVKGSNGDDDHNVYVMGQPGSGMGKNEHGYNLLIYISESETNQKINTFFDVAFKIMDAEQAGKVFINAQPREDVYTKLSNKLIWMDYRKKTTAKSKDDKYSAAELLSSLDIKLKGINSNNRNAYITKAFLRKSNGSGENKEIRPGLDGFQILLNEPRAKGDSFMDQKNFWRMNESKYEDAELKTEFGIKGYILRPGENPFAVQYTLDDFVEGYDELVFNVTACSEIKDKKDPTKKKLKANEQGEIVIDITERELFNLE